MPRALKTVRLLSVVLIAVMMAACARSSVVTHKYRSLAVNREASLKPSQPFQTKNGLASFYSEGSGTASGEKLVRVTNLSNGHAVTVRINDRGPFVRGRDVDVSYTAAQTLGMTEQGVAKVKLEIVH
ncbi:MAG: septal ring lytic transglycosylase RlpA family protein [Xanthobacteraceae bacterium]